MAFALEGGHPGLQRGVRARAGGPERGRRRPAAAPPGSSCASTPTWTPTHAKISTGKAENKFGVSSATPCASTPRRPSCPASSRSASPAHRQPDHRPGAVPRCLHADARPGGELRGAGHVDRAPRPGRRPRRALPQPANDSPSPEAYAAMVRETLGGLGVKLVLEPGRVIVANAGVLVTRVIYMPSAAATGLPGGRRGHERPDPADAVRGLARHPAGARGGSRGGARSAGRGGPGLRDRRHLARAGCCRPAPPATCSPS